MIKSFLGLEQKSSKMGRLFRELNALKIEVIKKRQ
jgi:hypothetical protein